MYRSTVWIVPFSYITETTPTLQTNLITQATSKSLCVCYFDTLYHTHLLLVLHLLI